MQHIAVTHRKALVVEEHAADRDLGVAILTQLNYQAEAASSIGDALARLAREPFPLVFLSSTLLSMAGPELAERLRHLGQPMRIVVMHPQDQPVTQGDADGDQSIHVTRPLSKESLKQLVQPLKVVPMSKSPEEPIVDIDHLLSFTDGDLELENELSVLFLSSAEAYFDRMSHSLQSATTWTSSAHALKGASANLGARRLAALARSAEHTPPAAADLRVIRSAIDEVSAFFASRQRTGSRSARH